MAYTPLTTKVDGDTFTTPMWTNIKDNFDALYPGHIICTSSTRPTVGLAEGHMIWETDTNKLLVYDGSVWKDVFPVAAPVGTVTQYAGSSAPTGYLLCDGSAVSRSTYADLFTILSTTYGAGDGSTTFNLPDLRGRVPMGAGTGAQNGGSGTGVISGGTALTARTRGAFGGDERLATHNHGITDPGHSHTYSVPITNTSGGTAGAFGNVNATWHSPSTSSVGTGITINNNVSGGSGGNMPPFVVLNHIIKT